MQQIQKMARAGRKERSGWLSFRWEILIPAGEGEFRCIHTHVHGMQTINTNGGSLVGIKAIFGEPQQQAGKRRWHLVFMIFPRHKYDYCLIFFISTSPPYLDLPVPLSPITKNLRFTISSPAIFFLLDKKMFFGGFWFARGISLPAMECNTMVRKFWWRSTFRVPSCQVSVNMSKIKSLLYVRDSAGQPRTFLLLCRSTFLIASRYSHWVVIYPSKHAFGSGHFNVECAFTPFLWRNTTTKAISTTAPHVQSVLRASAQFQCS